jgi:nitroimidazol reductase NimA-like FMN-containing flavoprotein (pyridoxamine 5'-phosphate oxidase superfamily)
LLNQEALELRRKEKEIIDKSEIESIIGNSLVCRLGLADDGTPYIVPLCFGYKDNCLYFHSAKEGRKVEILKQNNQVCFEFDITPEVKTGKTACAWGMKYQSVIGFGKALFIEDPEERRKALDVIMRQYADGVFEYSAKSFEKALVIKVEIESMTGKKSN